MTRMHILVKKRRGIGYALVMLFAGLVILGVVWAGLYYGVLSPLFTSLPVQYPGVFNSSDAFGFVVEIAAAWMVVLTFGALYWLWLQAQKDYAP